MRWSHLARHGLLGTTLLGLAAGRAAAEPCDDRALGTINVVLGLDLGERIRVVGGVEGRLCLDHQTDAMLRLELGGGSPRFIAGARARPFERDDEDRDLEQLGAEAGVGLDGHARFGLHAAATFGPSWRYAALQTFATVTGAAAPQRVSLLGAHTLTATEDETVVVGRPLSEGGRALRPALLAVAEPRDAEARAVRDHFASAAQLELSSVWTFLRLAEELAAVGAPAHLIAAALDAADDEVRHAELCAGAAGGVALAGLGAARARPRFAARTPHALATLAAEAWHEGCLNETAAAEEARLAAGEADGPARALLTTIARDEDGHAELAWAVLGWIASIAPAIARAARAIPAGWHARGGRGDRALARHGVPSPDVTAAAIAHATAVASRRVRALG